MDDLINRKDVPDTNVGDMIIRQEFLRAFEEMCSCTDYGWDERDFRDLIKKFPSAEPEIIRCKDCKHRDEDECPMRYVEWVTYEEDGYFESDDVVHDRTLDDGFCDRWEKDDTDE